MRFSEDKPNAGRESGHVDRPALGELQFVRRLPTFWQHNNGEEGSSCVGSSRLSLSESGMLPGLTESTTAKIRSTAASTNLDLLR